MSISRRNLLRRLGAGAAVTAAVPSLAEVSLSAALGGAWPSSDANRPSGPVRLHRNENAYGASAKAIAAMREAAGSVANRYPEAEVEALRQRIAGLHAVTPEHVVLGCGAAELLRMAAEAFAGPRGKVIVATPTFELIASCARRAGAEVVAVPLRRDYAHDLTAMLSRSDATTGLVYVCNPNNPTGSLTRRHDLEGFLAELPAATHVLIDEAYHHYAGESSDYASSIDRPAHDTRVIVARSFSTIHGLAGLRIGYAVAAPETARRLSAQRLPYGINAVGATAASAALDDIEHLRISVKRNADDRQEFFNQANARMLRAIDSHANFVLLNIGRQRAAIVEHFRKNGVLVSGPFPGFDRYIRVSLGIPSDMREFWRVWDLLPVHDMAM